MASKFYALLTTRGEAKLAQAVALGTQLKITQMAVGDGGGSSPTPNASQTKLVNQQRIAAINTLSVDPVNTSQIIAEQVIPEDEGGWWIREVGLFDDAGELIAIANCAETYKPLLAEGSGRTQVIRMVVIVSSTEAVTIKIDPSVVLATRKYVDDKVIEVKAYTDSVMKAHLDAADPHPQYAPKASPTFSGIPKAPTPANGNNSTQLATTQFVQAAIALLVSSSPAALDTLKELADALGNDPNFATTMTNQLALKAPLAAPTFTGIPKAPTPANGNNTTQLATTAFVQAAIAQLVASSPAALDTLKELADALGNDPNFATTMTNLLALKAPLLSPVFTGTPSAPTPASSDNSKKLATTEFVQAALAPALMQRGELPSDANINKYGPTSEFIGVWGRNTLVGSTVANGFPEDNGRGMLEVFPYGQSNGLHRYTVSGGRQYIRTLAGAWNGTDGPWSEWFNIGGLSQVLGLPATATSLTDPVYFSQSVTYSISGDRTDLPAGVNSTAVIMSIRRGASIMGLNQLLFTTTGLYERHGQTNANSGWTSVSWYAGGDANGWRLVGTDALAAIGLGLTSQTAVTAFDWQQADFVSGQKMLVNVTGWLNAPAELKNPAGDVITIDCVLARANANRFVVRLTSQSTTAIYKYDYTVVIANAKGSRTFTVTQNFTSDPTTVIPVANGGTGATTAAAALNSLGLGQGSALPVGVPVPWPSATPPAGWIKCNGATFSAATYPGLAIAFPTLKLPDLRGEFIRGWDDARAVDSGRAILSAQADALQNITGTLYGVQHYSNNQGNGAFTYSDTGELTNYGTATNGNAVTNHTFDASRVARTAAETRPRNIAFNYIVRAA